MALKIHKMKVACGICGKKRLVGIKHGEKILAGKQSNVCTGCSRSPVLMRELKPGEVRIKGKNGRWQILVYSPCQTCGTVRLIRPDQIDRTKFCHACVHRKDTIYVDPTIGDPHAISAPMYRRCHGLLGRDPCQKYERCMDLAAANDWNGFRCSDGTPALVIPIWERGELREFVDLLERESYDPLESALGLNVNRSVARRY